MDDPQNKPAESTMEIQLLGRRLRIGRFAFLMIMGVLVGAVTGAVTVVFRLAAIWGERWFFPAEGGIAGWDLGTLAAAKRVLMPALGGLVCGVILFKIGKYKGTHGIPAILQAVASGQLYFGPKVAGPPALAIVTLATGGSVGPEGPIAEIGAVMGSQLGRIMQAPPKMIKTLIGAGVAAGIAAVFNAPIGGMFFAIEVILRNYELASFTPIAVAAVVASVISQSVLGDQMAVAFPRAMPIGLGELPLFALLGVLCGVVSIAYIHGLGYCHDFFKRHVRTPLWMKPMIGGLVVGCAGLFTPQIMGEGYEWIRAVLMEGRGTVALLLLLVGVKIVMTGVTLGSGNPGGSFAPAVFIGVMLGAAFGALMVRAGAVESRTAYAVMGMAGMIAGALGAPLTAIMITLRHGSLTDSQMLLPLMTTVALCVFVMQLGRGVTVYTLEFLRLGIDLDRAREADPLSLVRVSAVMHASGYGDLPAEMRVFEALERCKDSAVRWFVVRQGDGEFCGIVSLHEMRLAIAEEELAHLLVVADITDGFMPRLTPEMNLREALASFNATEAEVLPVFQQGEGAVLEFRGVVSRQDALNAYARSIGG